MADGRQSRDGGGSARARVLPLVLGAVVVAVLLGVVFATLRQPGSRPAAAGPGSGQPLPGLTGWEPDLTEDFTSLDPSVWNVRNRQHYERDDAEVLAANVATQDGAIRIQARQQAVDGRSFTSGDLDTFGTYSLPNYFRIEVRAKVPFQQGMWAAPLWIRPADGSAGEIDLVETYGSERDRPIIHQTIHGDYAVPGQLTHLQTPFAAVGGSATDWHTYVVEKTPGAIRMWVDGVPTATFDDSTTPWFGSYYEAGKRWSLRMSLQVGGNQGLPDSTTDWSPDTTSMLVDYVHTYVPQS
ncbi:MAG: glycoside hydrolase family 16 protein [Nocardioidaceae bacterium]